MHQHRRTAAAITVAALGAMAGLLTATAHPGAAHAATAVPAYDHIVVLMEENHDYSEVVGSMPWIEGLPGATFTNSHGTDHPSEGNYITLYTGADQGMTGDDCTPGPTVPNLGSQLGAVNYSEDYPGACPQSGAYVGWHDAANYFSNVPAAQNRAFSAFPADYTTLPKVSFVAPNLNDDMHDGTIGQADSWAQANLGAYASWAATHNSLLVITTDEGDVSPDNQVFTKFVGAGVKAGSYSESINHTNVLATIEASFGQSGLTSSAAVTDVFGGAAPVTTTTVPPTTTTVPPTTTTTPPTTTTTPPPSSQWTLVGSDSFAGTAVDTSKWGVYGPYVDGSGNNRVPGDCQEGGGELKVIADANGNCGMAWLTDQTYGAWEVHARFDTTTSSAFDTTFIVWPQDDTLWQNAEIDYVEETDPARQLLGGFVHCQSSCSGGQIDASPNGYPLDMTQWHTYRVEWTPSSLTFLVDGKAWFTDTDAATITKVPHHGTIQTDGSAAGSAVVHVNSFRVYSYNGGGSVATTPPATTTPAPTSTVPPTTSASPPPPPDPIAAHYQTLGGSASYLGAAVGGEYSVGGGLGQNYQGGDIFWSQTSGAWAVHGGILAHYNHPGGPAGLLGFPTSDEFAAPGGRESTFTNHGAIFWSSATGAWSVHGAILDAYTNRLGGPGGILGYPTTDETGTPDGIGRYNHFTGSDQDGASVYWTPSTGAMSVRGEIRKAWASQGWEAGRCGYPIGDEFAIPGGRRSNFQGCYITWNPTAWTNITYY